MKQIQQIPNEFRKGLTVLPKLKTLNEKMDVFFPSMGLSGYNPFIGSDSASREAMKLKQQKNSISILGSEILPVITGMEYEIGEHVEQEILPANSTVLDIIPRYSGGTKVNTTIKYENGGVEDILVIKDLGCEDPKFGFRYVITDEFKNLKIGDKFDRDVRMSIGKSGSQGEFTYSANVRVANISHVETSKDAILVSRALLDSGKLDYLTVKTIKLGISKEVLYNLYGDENEYRPLPTPGEPVNPNGFVLGYLKPINGIQITKKRLLDQDISTMDNVYELPCNVEKATVKEVKVIKLCNSKPTEMTRQLEEYWVDTQNYYDSIDIPETDKQSKGSSYHNLLREIYSVKSGINTTYGDSNPDWYIEVTIEMLNRPTIKDKMVLRHGSKGIISAILPEEEMPYDSRGLRAEMIYDATAIERRMIPGAKYEGYLFDNAIWNNKKFLERLKAKDNNVKKDIIDYLSLWGNNDIVKLYRDSSIETILEVASTTGIRPVINIYDGNKTHTSITIDIMNSKFSTPLDGIWVPGPKGEEDYLIQQPVATEVVAVSMHYKNGETFQGVPTAHTNPLGGVVALEKGQKAMKSYNVSPLRAYSESEVRMMTQQGPEISKFIKRLRLQSNNPTAQARLIRHIMRKDGGFAVTRENEKKIFKGTNDTSVSMYLGMVSSFGVKLNTNGLKYTLRPNDCLE